MSDYQLVIRKYSFNCCRTCRLTMRLCKKHRTTADELATPTGAKYSKNLILPQAVAKLDYEQFALLVFYSNNRTNKKYLILQQTVSKLDLVP
jgi:hypothetical protein